MLIPKVQNVSQKNCINQAWMRLYKEIWLYKLIWFETKKNPND